MKPCLQSSRIRGALYAALSFLLVAFGASLVLQAGSALASPGTQIAREIEATHPSLEEDAPLRLTMVQLLDAKGWPEAYRIEIESVICRDVQCEIIPVWMYFDPLGNYLSFELQFGDELTKMDHIPFDKEDYDKLQQILTDANSPLRTIEADRVVTPEQAMATKKVDGISGATALTEEDAIVKGAAYTSYTLWHWANNPSIRSQAQLLTASAASQDQLLQFLKKGNEEYLKFAIEQFLARNIFNESARTAVADQITAYQGRAVKPILGYLEAASRATGGSHYRQFLTRNYHGFDFPVRVRILESMQAATIDSIPGFADEISQWLPQLETYQEVHFVLELLDAAKSVSSEASTHATELLEHDNFLVARRAFWFLEQKDLNSEQDEKVARFRSEFADRL